MLRTKDFCAIVPAYNEEKVITESLKSLKKVFDRSDIYVVSDGSTDGTANLARLQGVNVLNLVENCGKANAQEKVISRFRLTNRYSYILFTDADSRLEMNFLDEAKKYISEKPALIVGTVKSERKGIISAFRTFEYGLSHLVYKRAQNFIKAITVAPGCASLYNSRVLERLDLKSQTITEDLDLTIQIYKKKLGRIVYSPKSNVVTQDPESFKDYWKQVTRWNIGTWQNYFLHRLYRMNSKYNAEMNYLFIDSFLWLATVIIAILYPVVLVNFLLGVLITIYCCAFIILLIERRYWPLPYAPIFPIFYFINIISFFYSLFRVVLSKKKFIWNKVNRYDSAQ